MGGDVVDFGYGVHLSKVGVHCEGTHLDCVKVSLPKDVVGQLVIFEGWHIHLTCPVVNFNLQLLHNGISIGSQRYLEQQQMVQRVQHRVVVFFVLNLKSRSRREVNCVVSLCNGYNLMVAIERLCENKIELSCSFVGVAEFNHLDFNLLRFFLPIKRNASQQYLFPELSERGVALMIRVEVRDSCWL